MKFNDESCIISNASFMVPEYFVETAWVGHAPFAFYLMSELRPKCFVELGTHSGYSYFCFCQAIKQFNTGTSAYAIDTWLGDEHAGLYSEDVYESASLHNIKYYEFSTLLRMSFDEALSYFINESIDFLHIDGRHLYDDVKKDFESWLPKLSKDAVVIFHDTNVRERNFGVFKFFSELKKIYPAFEFYHSHGLGVIALGEIPSGLKAFFNGDDMQIRNIRNIYANLGHCMQGFYDRMFVQREATRYSEELNQLKAETERLTHEAQLALEDERLERMHANDQVASLTARLEAAEKTLEAERHERVRANYQVASLIAKIQGANDKQMIFKRAVLTTAFRFIAKNDVKYRFFLIKLAAVWRHPLRSRKRKEFRKYHVDKLFREFSKDFADSLDNRGDLAVTPIEAPPVLPAVPEVRTEAVDIIICVHNALDDVRRCLASVQQYTFPPYRFILVDDGSGAETQEFLAEFAAAHRAVWIRHDIALGYTFAANAGLRASDAPFCVLLNSDTEVTELWLERMMDHLRTNSSIGIVGPLSNVASWQSVPLLQENGDWAQNALPPGFVPNDMARLVAENASRSGIPMGFANGFCMLLRREMLDQIGLFDEETFAAGYGEENDLCIRARKAGWSIQIADDAYVFHNQSRSYGHDRRQVLAARADEALAHKHDPATHIYPQVHRARDSLLMQHVRQRLQTSLLLENLVATGKKQFLGHRVAIILPVASPGGGANVILQEAVAARAFGVDVWIINCEEYRSDFLTAYGHLDLEMLFAPAAAMARFIVDEHNRFEFDAIIATAWTSVKWLPDISSLVHPVALGYYIQDQESLFYDPHSFEYEQALATYVERPEIRRITKTQWNIDAITEIGGIAPVLIGPSIDLPSFRPLSDDGLEDDKPVRVIAMIRPSTPRRNPTLTFQVLQRLKERFGASVSAACFGASLEEMIANGYTHDGIEILGGLTPKLVAVALGSSDVFLDFSQWQAMGLTALEAMASGAAVVVPRRGGAIEVCPDGVVGLTVDTDDEESCFAAACRLVEDAGLRFALRHKAIEVAASYPPGLASLKMLRAVLT